jgi:hypothetical protein
VPIPHVPGRQGLDSVYGADDFVAHLRANCVRELYDVFQVGIDLLDRSRAIIPQ